MDLQDDLQRAEQTLRQREAELSAVLASSAEANARMEMVEQIGRFGHWRITLPEQIVTWSPEIYRIFRLTPASFTPTYESVMALFHPDDWRHLDEAMAQTMRTGEPFDLFARVTVNGAELRHARLRVVAQFGPDGAPCLIFGVLADVTDQVHLQQALREANERLERVAHVDVLTGLANRRRFDETLEREWRRSMRERTPLSLVMLDLDRFKSFNDRYGHLAGDDCLRRVAAVLARMGRRPGDLAARYGGEELALILPSTGATGAEKIAREVRSAIADMGIAHEGNVCCGCIVTASLGAATADPAETKTISNPSELIAEADRLLYEAKRTGRNRVGTAANLARGGASPVSPDEAARLASLAAYERAGATRRTREMDRIARMAATLTGAPIGLVSLVGRDSQQFAGNFGLDGVPGTRRDVSFCAHTILGDEPMVIADATRDPRFKNNPLVTGDLGIRYYAGAPIVSRATGHNLGALCVIDTQAHAQTSRAECALLTDLAEMAASLLDDEARAAGEGKEESVLF